MKSTHALRLLSLAALAGLVAAPALAEEGGYYYGGLSAGRSQSKIDNERITATLLGAGLTTSGMTDDQHDTAYRLFGGYQFNSHLGLEAGYFHLGQFGFKSTTVPAGTLTGQIKLQGLNLDLVGALPLTDRLSVIGRVGAQYATARDQFSGTGAVVALDPSPSRRELNAKVGAGLQYALSRSFLMRLEAERYRVNDAVGNHGGVNVVSLSLVIPFGREAQTSRQAMAEPVYVAPAPAPVAAPAPIVEAPVAAAPLPPVAPAPARQRVSFSADSLFNFDKAAIGPAGQADLDKFVQALKGTQFDVITVEGHTDRLGSQHYNQTLSMERARAVKDYLVVSGKLDAAKITAVGKGESAPVTKPEDCKGSRPTRALIACLQPDRRVEVEVTGTR